MLQCVMVYAMIRVSSLMAVDNSKSANIGHQHQHVEIFGNSKFLLQGSSFARSRFVEVIDGNPFGNSYNLRGAKIDRIA